MNSGTLGVCLIGDPEKHPKVQGATMADIHLMRKPYATDKQMKSLVAGLAILCMRYGLDPQGTFRHPLTGEQVPVISQHSDHDKGKPNCASLCVSVVRELVAKEIARRQAASFAAAAAVK